ncbi:MAG: hypothetical protein EBR30_21910 [Cytophagia bacterium]|nr:hypothetical protein [Cytophagia bacterium]
MNTIRIYKILTIFIASVWLVNGLLCKVLNLVPRHEEIVIRIMGSQYARPLTILIGLSEIVMAIWILSSYKTKLNAVIQMTVVALMNILEFILASDLLLWGKLNSIFAFMFILIVYLNEFHFNKKLST